MIVLALGWFRQLYGDKNGDYICGRTPLVRELSHGVKAVHKGKYVCVLSAHRFGQDPEKLGRPLGDRDMFGYW